MASFPYMTITFRRSRFIIQLFVALPEEGEMSIEEVLEKFKLAGYHCTVAEHSNRCKKDGIDLSQYQAQIFPEVIFDEKGEFSHHTGRTGYLIKMKGGYTKMPSIQDPKLTKYDVLFRWIGKLNQQRLARIQKENADATTIPVTIAGEAISITPNVASEAEEPTNFDEAIEEAINA